MARAPDKRIGEAEAMYLAGWKLVDIAEKLGLPEGTVRRWKCTHKWDSERPDKKANVRKRGAQPGNRNAAGHGGTGPPGNKNAVKTGEFEALFFDTLDPEEKQLIGSMPTDKESLLLHEIRLLTVRERRMLKRIEDIRTSAEDAGGGETDPGMMLMKHRSGTDRDKETDLKEYQGSLGRMQAVEDALTRVQARKQKAVDSLHRFSFDDARLEIEMMKLDLAAMKLDSRDEETRDDGFLDALNAESGSLWGGGDG